MTASWQSATWTWDGLLSSVALPVSGVTPGVGGVTVAARSFALSLNVFGVLAGFACGLLLAEWTGTASADRTHRAAFLTRRDAASYLARWVRVVLVVSAIAALATLAVAATGPHSASAAGHYEPGSPWWAIVLVGVGVGALATRAGVLSSPPHAADGDALATRELTRALTAATLTVVALAAFTGSAASSLGRVSTWYGWGWGDGTATAAIALSLVTTGLVVAAFLTPYWAIASDVGARAHLSTP
ncbi:MAG TPA: hypothetical protein VHM89_09105 [Acidimicrobiales bacterium]|nr:hypothetical protein [Acidimicrobiales bacterium]